MADVWMDDDLYMLISMYEQHPHLCDPSMRIAEYKNKVHKQNVEEEIVGALEKLGKYVYR